MSRFINTELKSNSDSDSSDLDLDSEKLGAKVYNKLMTEIRKIWFWFWISLFTNFKQLKKISYFAGFREVKHKTPLGESRYLNIYFFLFFIFSFLFISFFFSSLTLLPREVKDFPRGGNHSKYMHSLTYLAWLQPICYNSSLVFIHINITKIFTCGENFDTKKVFFQVQFLKKKFFFRYSFWKYFFFRFSFWKYYFFPGPVFENIIFCRFSFWE